MKVMSKKVEAVKDDDDRSEYDRFHDLAQKLVKVPKQAVVAAQQSKRPA